ncbi:MAG: phage virion morphogenesis protein [Lentimicrobium sp.]|jgi:phage gpG-like protein|nr:phage virion morphogenesis protein [Lentimicrobium sp.]
MTPEEYKKTLQWQAQKIKKAVSRDLPIIIGKKAVDIYTTNFQKEGFQNANIEPWKEVKRRQNPRTKGAAKKRKILTGKTGDLGRSIKYDTGSASVTIYSDVPYAAVHNEGLRAGRGAGFQMPQRQFIGDSLEVDEMIETEIDNMMNQILNI